MVKKELLSERQRKELKDYLRKRPSAMPGYVRTLRGFCKEIDFKQMEEDLFLMKEIARIKVKMGRKSSGYDDRKAKLIVRHPFTRDAKALFKTRHLEDPEKIAERISQNILPLGDKPEKLKKALNALPIENLKELEKEIEELKKTFEEAVEKLSKEELKGLWISSFLTAYFRRK